MGYYAQERLEKSLREKLSSRGVNVDQLVFEPTLTKRGNAKVNAFRDKTWMGSANVDWDGFIWYSMPKTDPKQG